MPDKKLFIQIFVALSFLLSGCSQINQIIGAAKVDSVNISQNITQPFTNTTQNITQNVTNTTTSPPKDLIIPPIHYGNLTAYFINVGQGDSIFIVGPGNKTMLIDCGPSEAGPKVVSFIRNLGFESINQLIVSHQHADHIGGCPLEILKLRPEKIYDNGMTANTETYNNYRQVWTNHTAIGQDGPFDFDLVSSFFIVPYDDGQGFSSNENDNSLIVKMAYYNSSFMFTGDCESDCEARIINSDVSANVLKVGHHGSKTSSSVLFLNRVTPNIAIISVGVGNQYGHPAPETIEKLKGKMIYRTDVDGSIVVTTDGKTIGVEKVKT